MKITFIGGGNMAIAMIGGMLKQGFSANQIHVVEPSKEQREHLNRTYAIECSSPDQPLLPSDVILFAVKPQQLKAVAQSLSSQINGALVISIAAGVRADTLAKWLDAYPRIVRVMPNTPALVQAGMSGAYATSDVTPADRALTERMLAAIGEMVWVESESEIDGITAISGSGPAYVFYFMEALQAAAQAQGFTPDVARKLAYKTFEGAVKLALQSEDDAATLRKKVTSKGGTTEQAINTLEASQVRTSIIAAAAAAAARSQQLGDES
ncbi:pyrroline-5-carboxylate reductase [Iodobacter sp.]|uniref:pyrroline-5-carboxylate reductase n=1 Tax=Iodobacter sp. TaxID=1915058 RepID=UPI0025D87E3C|nr:pyrroline-5-carboxylate reductase [Iodobacter sp.]